MAIKTPPKDRRVRVPDAPTSSDFAISAKVIRWLVGGAGALLAIIVGWFAVWDRIDTHWRIETIQQAKDKETEAKLHSLAQKAEIGRAWLFWSVLDFKADWRDDKAETCRQKKQDCTKLESAAQQARAEAIDAKRAAIESGKDK